jgi:hypothetical protein
MNEQINVAVKLQVYMQGTHSELGQVTGYSDLRSGKFWNSTMK